MSSAFHEDGSKFLTPSAFEFVLEAEMKRAVRRQNCVTLVLVETMREWEGVTVAADDGTLREVGRVRLITRIEDYDFQTTLRNAVGAACSPTQAVDVDSLKRGASSRAVVNRRRGARSSPHRTEAGSS